MVLIIRESYSLGSNIHYRGPYFRKPALVSMGVGSGKGLPPRLLQPAAE